MSFLGSRKRKRFCCRRARATESLDISGDKDPAQALCSADAAPLAAVAEEDTSLLVGPNAAELEENASKRPKTEDAPATNIAGADAISGAAGAADPPAQVALASRPAEDVLRTGAEMAADRESDEESRAESAELLVNRLLTDPDEHLCPILHSMMEHPAVAEDGFTYEQKAIEEALQYRHRSPKTNMPMGTNIIPNRDKKTAIINYKEQTVLEIISVAPRVSSYYAGKLLQKAESFVRPELPDRTARATLLQLLRLKAGRVVEQRRDAVSELLSILSGWEDSETVMYLLQNFEAYGLQSHLSQCDDRMVAKLQAAARIPPTLPCHGTLDWEHGRRLLAKARTADGAQALWQFVLPLSTGGDPGDWMDTAALVLAAVHDAAQVDLAALPDDLLQKAKSFLQDEPAASARASELFDSELNWGSDQDRSRFLVTLLFELSKRCPEEGVAQSVMREAMQLLLQLEPSSILALAKQVAADGRAVEAAQVGVAAAQAFTSCNRQEEALQAYLFAYSLDPNNAHASRGAVAEASKTCSELQKMNREQHATIASQGARIAVLEEQVKSLGAGALRSFQDGPGTTLFLGGPIIFSWDISQEDFSGLSKGEYRESPKIAVPGLDLKAWIRYHPQGEERSRDGFAGVFLMRDQKSKVQFELSVDSNTWKFDSIHDQPWAEAGEGRGNANSFRQGPHRKIQAAIHAVRLRGSDDLTYRFQTMSSPSA